MREYRDYTDGELRRERATKRGGEGESLRRTTVISTSGTRSEMLPSDPVEVAKILKARRAKKTPARRTRERIAADLKKRGV